MKYSKKITSFFAITLILICVASLSAFGQQHQYRGGNKIQKQKQNQENIESQKIAYITDKVGLTPAEAKEFWPIYNEYEAKRKEIRKDKKLKNFDNNNAANPLTEKEAEEIIDEQIKEAQKMLDLRKEYHGKFKAILPATKVLKLYEAEKDFQKVMIDKLRNRKNQNTPASPVKPGK